MHLKTSFNAVLFGILNKFVVNNKNFMTVVMYSGCTIAFVMLLIQNFISNDKILSTIKKKEKTSNFKKFSRWTS